MGVLNKPTKEPQKGLPQAFFGFRTQILLISIKKMANPSVPLFP